MPRFNPDPSKVTIGFPVYPKGTYLVELSDPKTFYRVGKQDASGAAKADNYGVQFAASKIADGPEKGKPFPITCMMHTPGSEGFSKVIQMAVLGYNPKDDKEQERFNITEAGDWSFNTDENSCGDQWHKMKGKVVAVDVDEKIDMTSGVPVKQQDIKAYRPA